MTGAVVSGIVVGPAAAADRRVAGQQQPAGHPATHGQDAEDDQDDQEASAHCGLHGRGAGGRRKDRRGSLSRPWTPEVCPRAGRRHRPPGRGHGGRRHRPRRPARGGRRPAPAGGGRGRPQAGQPAMGPIWHLALAARDPDPAAALAGLRRRLGADADAAVAAATAWLRERLAGTAGGVATAPTAPWSTGSSPPAPPCRRVTRWRGGGGGRDRAVGAPNADGTRELATRLPTLVVATAASWSWGRCSERLGGAGFEVVPLAAVAAVVVGPEVLSPAEAGRRALGPARGLGAAPAQPRSPRPRPGAGRRRCRGPSLPRRRPARPGCRGPRRGRARRARRGGRPGRPPRPRGRPGGGGGGPARRRTPGGRGGDGLDQLPDPSPRSATVRTTGTCQGRASPRWSIWRRSRATTSAPSRSALLTTNTSATSRMPALATWTASRTRGPGRPGWCRPGPPPRPRPGRPRRSRPGRRRSRRRPAPAPACGRPGQAAQVAGRPSSGCRRPRRGRRCIRTRSPSRAPPVNGEDRSTASTPTVSPWAGRRRPGRRARVDLPTRATR